MAGVILLLVWSTASATNGGGSDSKTGSALLQRKCLSCHSSSEFDALEYDRAQWQRAVEDMKPRGVDGTDEELQALIDYLAERFGPRTTAAEDH